MHLLNPDVLRLRSRGTRDRHVQHTIPVRRLDGISVRLLGQFDASLGISRRSLAAVVAFFLPIMGLRQGSYSNPMWSVVQRARKRGGAT